VADDDDEPEVSEAFVLELARRVAHGELTTEAALIAVDLAAGRQIGRRT
jgi:hypothetical protein